MPCLSNSNTGYRAAVSETSFLMLSLAETTLTKNPMLFLKNYLVKFRKKPNFLSEIRDAQSLKHTVGSFSLSSHAHSGLREMDMLKTEKNTILLKTPPCKPLPVWGEYRPFGTVMQDRSFSSPAYRYGFNGKEKDAEVYGEGNVYDYGFRVYNPRLGKFLSVDPLTREFPFYSPYHFAGNRPIVAIDLDGLEPHDVMGGTVWGPWANDNEARKAALSGSAKVYLPDLKLRLRKNTDDNSHELHHWGPPHVFSLYCTTNNMIELLSAKWGITFSISDINRTNETVANGEGRKPKPGMWLTDIPMESMWGVNQSIPGLINGPKIIKPEAPKDPELTEVLSEFTNEFGDEPEKPKDDSITVYRSFVKNNITYKKDTVKVSSKDTSEFFKTLKVKGEK